MTLCGTLIVSLIEWKLLNREWEQSHQFQEIDPSNFSKKYIYSNFYKIFLNLLGVILLIKYISAITLCSILIVSIIEWKLNKEWEQSYQFQKKDPSNFP